MTHASSIQLSQELRIHRSHGCYNQHTNVIIKEKNRVHLVNVNLSSDGLRPYYWTLHFLNSVHRPILPVPSRCNIFVCQSLLTPVGGNDIPVLKSASMVLARSYDALCGSPLLIKLIPAVGVIAFAAWGLGPLLHLGRIIFLHKSDSSWNKSSTNYVLTSYLQPLLLWTGAVLICRALDPVVLQTEVSQAVKQRFLNFIWSLSTVLAFSYCLSSLMQQAQKFFTEANDSSGARNYVGWWSPTIIRGDDREAIHIPNHKFTMNVVRNLSQKTHWRIKTHLAVSHLDVNKVNNIVADMRKVLAKNPQVEQQRLHRRVFLDNINPENQALMIFVSCFVKTSHFEEYLCVKGAILLDLLRVISHHRARLATPIRTVQKIYSEADLDNVPFADTIFTGSQAAANRPLLLIEPFYKINGDDRTNASTHSVHTYEEKDTKAEAVYESIGNSKVAMPMAESKTDKVTTTATTSDPKVSAIPASDPQLGKLVLKNSEQNNFETKKPSGSMEEMQEEKIGLNSEDTTTGRPTREEYSVTESKRSGNPSAISQAKQDVERSATSAYVARPPLEENIVLGVALEGSKRTLPIEEEIAPSAFPLESKELAASWNGGLSPSSGKEKKDGKMPTVPSTSQTD